ncbi:DNA adenine methylase [Streptomyces poonensis]|uniref:site-specific DNA-methyltransferase (adenine-specific) n=1 Tax=Streptomyces poonensis TaxID=68255 RepID=A0A918UCL5_9ACTN|nr:DNA adenine methylase [Streptomyces poonensis]GGY88466.1 DNA methyltransferase [Streptomyces poonensis]GLJ92373.1 DNA methyltransferase [Streptomyces poonensis]
MRYISPLRYPGGKARLAPYIARLISRQRPRPRSYAEAFAGGAGAALRLLANNEVDHIHINDLDPGVAALWRCIFHDSENLTHLVASAEVSITEWYRHAEIYKNPSGRTDIELGFSTFFLNRCNRSGILRARPIGGLDQTGNWKIDARFSRESLIERINYLATFRDRVTVTQMDARSFIRHLEPQHDDILMYVDPPYIVQGDRLYLDSLTGEDHKELANILHTTPLKWLLTYDANKRITEDLYKGFRCVEFDILHTAQIQRTGVEYAIFGNKLILPEVTGIIGEGNFRWMTSKRKREVPQSAAGQSTSSSQ